MKNQRLLNALLRQPVDKTPVWLMRQAGRYLPEYRALRSKTRDFITFCQTPDLAVQATLQPLVRFDLDAAIIFSDILTIPDAMGLGLYFVEGEGPRFSNPVQTKEAILKLSAPDPHQELHYVMEALRQVKPSLSVPLIGFSGSPWTLATYMVEGGPTKQFNVIKRMLYREPELLLHLLNVLVKSVTDYLNAQIESGADTVMLFDTWGGVLTTEAYQKFSLNPMKEIIKNLTRERDGKTIPVILFTKNSSQWLEQMADSGCDALGVDWSIGLDEARARVGDKVALQGNMDPTFLYAKPEVVQQEVRRILQSYGEGTGHVFNLGHGMLPDLPLENVSVLVDAVHG